MGAKRGSELRVVLVRLPGQGQVLVSVLDQERVWQQEHKDCARERKQVRGREPEPEPDELVVQAHRVLHQGAHPLFPQRPPVICVRPTGDTDKSSTVHDRGNRIRFGIDTSYGNNQC